jgi:Mg-chelatase subunit ChlD
MSFLAPAFFIGLAAIAVPVLIHLIQRERKEVVHFPSLMFLRRIPYQSVQRRRIHNWLLLCLRAAAIALLVAAFSRPFFKQDAVKAAAATLGAREVVILLDQSASMGYGDHWQKAREAARAVVRGLHGEDKATLVLFARNAEENVRATSDQGRLEEGLRDASVTSDATRLGPALRLAQSLLSRSMLPRKEAVLISDFQKTGWEHREEIHLPEGATLTPVSVATPDTSNLSVSSVTFERKSFSGEERVSVTAGLTNRSATPVTNLPVTLEVDGRALDTRAVTVGPNASASVTFPPFTVAEANMRGTVRAGSDLLPKDNVFHFVLSPSRPASVLVVNGDGASDDTSLYLSTALPIGEAPTFKVDVVPVSRVTPSTLERRSVVVLNDATLLPAPIDALLKGFVEQGGGLLIGLGDHNAWAGGTAPLLPGTVGAVVDRTVGAGGTLGYLDYSHPIFELFKQPRNGNFTTVRFQRYRALAAAPTDHVLARFDDGAAAMVERRIGNGRVIAWTSTLDNSWNDLPLHYMYLLLLRQTAGYLAHYDEPTAWYTVGRILDATAPLEATARDSTGAAAQAAPRRPGGVVVTPSGKQSTLGEGGAPSIELDEQGFYSVRMQGTGERRPFAVAVNLDPAESDLTPMEPHEFVKAATGSAAVTPTGQSLEHPDLTPEDVERKQTLWWFLLLGGVLALLAEATLSNRASRRFGVGLLQLRRR